MIELLASTDDDDAADDPEAVKLMIDFLYLHDYEAPIIAMNPEETNQTKPPGKAAVQLARAPDCNTIMHVKMYAPGSKYQIEALKAAALTKFTEAVEYA